MKILNKNLFVLLSVFLFILFNQLSQYLVTGSADLDQAEQLLFSQSFSAGYGAQPPLYTYIVKSFFDLFGEGLFTLLLIKSVVLFAIVFSSIAISSYITLTPFQSVVLVFSYIFIPQFIWESQRDLTHSPLVSLFAMLFLLQVFRTRLEQSYLNFALLGVIAALIILTKYSAVLFLVTVFVVVMLHKDFRKALLLDRRVFLALTIFVLTIAQHFFWLEEHQGLLVGSFDKLKSSESHTVDGIMNALVSFVAFVTPLWLFSLLVLDIKNIRTRYYHLAIEVRFLVSCFVASLLVVLVFVLVSGAQEIKDRWYQPLMVYLPVLIAAFSFKVRNIRGSLYIGLGVFFALLVSFALPARTVLAEKLGKFSRPNMPLIELGELISSNNSSVDFVLAGDRLLGGNLVLSFPQSIVVTSNNHHLFNNLKGNILLVCLNPDCSDSGVASLLSLYGLDYLEGESADVYTLPYRYASDKNMSLYVRDVFSEE